MWNLIKNVLRSLSKNKIAIIGLTFLIFLSVGIFTVLQSTTTSIDRTFEKVSISGNQHDFTVSERYNTGYITLEPGNKDGSKGIGYSKDGEKVYWPDQTPSGADKYLKIYYFRLQEPDDEHSLLYSFYNEYKDKPDTEQYKLIYKTINVENSNHLTYMDGAPDKKSSLSYTEIQNQLSAKGSEDSDMTVINKELANWSNQLEDYLNTSNSPLNQYLNSDEMKNKVYFRNFSSLQINNSTDNIYYNMVESTPADSTHPYDSIVDREILFDNPQFNNLGWHNFSSEDWKPSEDIVDTNDLVNTLSRPFKDWKDITTDDQQIIRKQFKILAKGEVNKSDPATKFYDGVNKINDTLIANPDNFGAAKDLYQGWYADFKFEDLNNQTNTFTITYEYGSNNVPFTWYIDDWTSNFSVCAPQFMEKHGLMPFDVSKVVQADADYQKWITNHQDIVTERARFISWMNSLKQSESEAKLSDWEANYPNSVVKVGGGTPFIILSAGITGDYVYPVVSIDRPIPNTEKECILFVNHSGYRRVWGAFQGNPTEKYIVGKFYNQKDSKKILDQINNWCKTNMSWPSNITAAYMANDLNCTLNAAAFRINYIPQLVNKIDLISLTLTIFILVVGLLISGIIVRRYVNNMRVTIGIMQANGIKKWSIAMSLIPFAFIPSVIGGVCGYLLGTFLQTATIGLFSAYWTLPTTVLSFSWSSLLVAVFLPFGIFTLVSIISTYIILRERTIDLMKSGSEYKANWLAKIVKKPVNKFNVVTKFRVSIAFNSLWKLFILSLMSAIAMASLVFSFSINGKFDSAINQTQITRNYEYGVDLYTPTEQGGQYIPISADNFGQSGFQTSASNVGENFLPNLFYSADDKVSGDASWNDIKGDTKKIAKHYYSTTFTTVNVAHGHLFDSFFQGVFTDNRITRANAFIPYMSDSIGQKTDLQYLKNRVSSKLTMNYLIGLSFMGLTSNPWNISATLMPSNIKNICNDKYSLIINEAGKKVEESQEGDDWYKYKEKKFFNKVDAGHGEFTYEINQSNAIDYTGMVLNHDFTKMMFKIYSDPTILSSKDDFTLAYNAIPLSKDDETYTYIDGDATNRSNFGSLPSNVKIVGLDNNTQFINLVNDDNKSLLPLLSYQKYQDSNIYPLVINKLVEKKYGLHIGDTISFDITNTTDRYQKIIDNDTSKTNVTFKVVGVTIARENEEYFTDQQIANHILGLKSKLDDSYKLNNYYIDYTQANKCTFSVDEGTSTSASYGKIEDLISLKDSNDDSKNIVPYGFNGYFTKNTNGSKGLSGGYWFYSPSGLWLPADQIDSQSSKDVLKYGANLQLACIFFGLSNTDLGKKINDAYQKWQNDHKKESHNEMISEENINSFIRMFTDVFGTKTDYVTLVANAMDKNSNYSVYKTMSDTISQIEILVITIISFMVLFIVLLMSTIIIGDSKKLAAILSSLGYKDGENALSFMSIYIPVILLGLLIAIPLTMGFVAMFQLSIMNGIGILIDASTKWFYYLIGASVVVVELIFSVLMSWVSLRRSSLIEMIK